ncbi:MAG: hypothetical protein ACLPOO_10150 [Terriglobales bacterium]
MSQVYVYQRDEQGRPSHTVNVNAKKRQARAPTPNKLFSRRRHDPQFDATLVWGGHSWPPKLRLLLNFGGDPNVNIKINFNINGDGQECPSHTIYF